VEWEREKDLHFLEIYFLFCDYKEKPKSMTQKEIKSILNILNALKVRIFNKHIA